jgi:transposase
VDDGQAHRPAPARTRALTSQSAGIVYDLFHVIAKYGRRQVIDRVHVDRANRLRNDKPARRLVKSSCCLWARNRRT